MNILEQLAHLDLNGRQAKVYLALLQLGSASAIEIAKYTKLKHPTVYDVLDVLKEKHLVNETFSGRRKLFTPENPEVLQENEERRQNALSAVLPNLKELYLGGNRRPRVYYYEGVEGTRMVQEELLKAKSKKYYYFGSVQEMLKLSGEEQEKRFVKERVARGIHSYSIRYREHEVNLDYLQPGEKNLRHVRYFPRRIDDNISGLYIFDDKIVIASGLKENYSIVIESAELYILMKTLWECIWEIAEEP